MRIALLLLSLALGPASLSQQPNQATATTSDAPIGRYQLLAAPVENGAITPQKTVFLLDTATGRVWRFRETVVGKDESGKEIAYPPLFESIPVASLTTR
jgi:hypothetical protein